MGPRAAVFLHHGLGDGIACLGLSNNLQLNGWQVDTYQHALLPLQCWCPHLPILREPPLSELPRILSSYDWFFVTHNDTNDFVLQLVREGKRRFPDRIRVMYLYPSKRMVNEPYYGDMQIDPTISVPENMIRFCERILKLPKITKGNGLIPPEELIHRRDERRVVIHPTSSREGKNWPKEKYVKLALHLQSLGYEIVFLPGDKTGWEEVAKSCRIEEFSSLDGLARFIYESGFFIGNDSGLGHLASALQIPTLTVCRRKTLAHLWAPRFSVGEVVTPSRWIPNIRGLRLRDQYWKKFVSVDKMLKAFLRLTTVT